MQKVIVERPRSGRSWAKKSPRLKTVRLAAEPEDFDGGPGRAPGRRDKYLNENLAPLERIAALERAGCAERRRGRKNITAALR